MLKLLHSNPSAFPRFLLLLQSCCSCWKHNGTLQMYSSLAERVSFSVILLYSCARYLVWYSRTRLPTQHNTERTAAVVQQLSVFRVLSPFNPSRPSPPVQGHEYFGLKEDHFIIWLDTNGITDAAGQAARSTG